MSREYAIIYHSFFSSLKRLSDSERGRLLSAVLNYSIDEEIEELRGSEIYLFDLFKEQIDREKQQYKKQCELNKVNGKRGGRPPSNTVAKPKKTTTVISKPQIEKEYEDEEKEDINISLTTFEIYNNARENLICECIVNGTYERCKRKSTYRIDGKNYCNQHSKAILKNIETCEVKNSKIAYGEFKNVLLTSSEVEKLRDRLENEFENLLEEMSSGIAAKGYKYKDHYAALLNWSKRKNASEGGNKNGLRISADTDFEGKPKINKYPDSTQYDDSWFKKL